MTSNESSLNALVYISTIDTDLPIEEARKKYSINEVSLRAGDVSNYSTEIRKFK